MNFLIHTSGGVATPPPPPPPDSLHGVGGVEIKKWKKGKTERGFSLSCFSRPSPSQFLRLTCRLTSDRTLYSSTNLLPGRWGRSCSRTAMFMVAGQKTDHKNGPINIFSLKTPSLSYRQNLIISLAMRIFLPQVLVVEDRQQLSCGKSPPCF